MTSANEVLKLRLPSLLKRAFAHICAGQGKSASEVIRQLIVNYIIENNGEGL